jgi:hypothetical protein
MIGIALDLRGDAILDSDQEGAGIGAVVRAGGPNLGGRHQKSRENIAVQNVTLYDSGRRGDGVADFSFEGIQ